MLASDDEISRLLRIGAIGIDPCSDAQLQPCSVDVTLDDTFRILRPGSGARVIDPRLPVDHLYQEITVPEDGEFALAPLGFALAGIRERIEVGPGHGVFLHGVSSLGRLGLIIHATAGLIDPGFSGFITLELFNCEQLPILLHPGMRIGQLTVHELSRPAGAPYGANSSGRYQYQPRGPQVSRYWRDPHRRPDPGGNQP